MTRNAAWDRLGAVSGILFSVLVIIGIQVSERVSGQVDPDDVAGVVAIDFGQRHDDIRFSAILLTVGVFFLFWFLAFLRSRLEDAGVGSGWLPSVAYGSGMTAGALLLVLASFGFAGSVVSNYQGDWEVAKTVLLLTWDHLFVVAPAMASLVIATTAVAVRSGGLPAWLGWLSAVLVVAPVAIAPELMTVTSLVWVIVVSVVLLYQTFSEHPKRPA